MTFQPPRIPRLTGLPRLPQMPRLTQPRITGLPNQVPNLPVPPKNASTCLVAALLIVSLSCICLVTAGLAGYFLIQTHTVDQRTLLQMAGRAPGEVNFTNLGDAPLNITVKSLSTIDTSTKPIDPVRHLEPFDADGMALQPGRYQLSFVFGSGPAQTCTIRITTGDFYQFATTSSGTVITNDRLPAARGNDLRMNTSQLCQQ
jgi:hypothetical protein